MERLFPQRWPGLLLVAVLGLVAAVSVSMAGAAADTGLSAPLHEPENQVSTEPAAHDPQAEEAWESPEPAPNLPQVRPADPIETPKLWWETMLPRLAKGDFWPPLDGPALAWFAVVVILLLGLRVKTLFCQQNLDALVLAATCLLLVLRTDAGLLSDWPAGKTGQWWSYLLLSAAAGYWLLRGLRCLLSRTVSRHDGALPDGAMFVLVLAGLAIGIAHIATDPLSSGSQDGIVGGLCTAQTGKLPYGEAPGHDSRSPLLYLLHAGAVKVLPPETTWTDDDSVITMSWEGRDAWPEDWWQAGDFAAARLVNALLFVLLLLALSTIGRRLHSASAGLVMVALFCVFPGTVECLTRPDIMLPATLLAWSVALAVVPGVGGLLSLLLIVMAGLAWPWAWLALPVLLGYFLRQGWEAVGAVVGVVAGIAISLVGLLWLTLPSLPQADGALARAGLPPAYTISRSDDGALVPAERAAGELREPGWLGFFWKYLVRNENLILDSYETSPEVSAVRGGDIGIADLFYRKLDPTADARAEVTERYRAEMARQGSTKRLPAALRTALEHTWLAAAPAATDLPGTWELWSAQAGQESWWPMIRKLTKLLAGLIGVGVVDLLLFGRRPQPHQLVGGLLVVSSATLLTSYLGAVDNLAWLLPTVLALWAVHAQPPAAQQKRDAPPPLLDTDSGPAPRISVDR